MAKVNMGNPSYSLASDKQSKEEKNSTPSSPQRTWTPAWMTLSAARGWFSQAQNNLTSFLNPMVTEDDPATNHDSETGKPVTGRSTAGITGPVYQSQLRYYLI